MYKPQKMTPEIAHRRTVKNCLALMGYTAQEIQDLVDAGVQEAEAIQLSILALAEEQASFCKEKAHDRRI